MVQFCTNCGSKVNDDDLFCTNCGNKLIKPDEKPVRILDRVTNAIEAPKIEKSKFIDSLFESEEIQSKINEWNISELQVDSMKLRLKNSEIVYDNETKREEFESIIMMELEKERDRLIKSEFYANRMNYVEDKLNESCSNSKLASFERDRINNLKANWDIEEELNKMTNHIINTHEKIGKYDFAGVLIEDGGFTNAVDIISLQKNLRKDSDLISYVFLKIFENNLKIIGSEFEPIYFSIHMTPRYKSIPGRDRTIFFNDITSVGYSNGKIYLNLGNKEKLVLKEEDSTSSEQYIGRFYNLLLPAWENFKNVSSNVSTNEKVEVSAADELQKYAELYEKGLLSEEEFNAIKKKLLGL